jgi:SAM-dependent methyltransferase
VLRTLRRALRELLRACDSAYSVHAMNDIDPPRYDRIGTGYAATRREDPRLRERIERALGEARSVVNVGAGAGSYEPEGRHVVAIEPSDVMAAQRPRSRAPAIRASAADLPLRRGSVDAAMAVLTLHHWDDARELGVREMRRVATGPVVIVTIDADVSGAMWLMADYLTEVGALDRQIFPRIEQVADWLGGETRVEILPVARDTPDWTLLSFWAHPERVLDRAAREATSGFARMPRDVVERVVSDVDRDLRNGAWEARNGHLRTLDALDVGLRMVVSRPTKQA